MSQTQSWFEIQPANAAVSATDVLLYDAIGGYGIAASAFVDALNAVKTKAINLFVNSPGGDVADGTAIFNALKRHPAKVHAIVDGMAGSIASVIVQAANKISMGPGSVMVIHDAHGLAVGDAAVMLEVAETLGLLSDNIAQIYADRAGGTAEEWRERMRAETWYKASDAVEAKLADELVPHTKASNLVAGRAFNLSAFKHVPEWAPVAPDPTPVAEAPKIAAPDSIAIVHNMNIPPAQKRLAIAHLKARRGITAAA